MFLVFNSVLTSKCLDLFEVTNFFNSVSKSVFVTKLAPANLASKTPAANLLNLK